MRLTETQRLALVACKDGQHRTRHEIRRAANLTALSGSTLRAQLDGDATYTITRDGLAMLGGGR